MEIQVIFGHDVGEGCDPGIFNFGIHVNTIPEFP